MFFQPIGQYLILSLEDVNGDWMLAAQMSGILGNNTGNCYPIIASFVISDNLASIWVIPGTGQNLMINRFERQQPNW